MFHDRFDAANQLVPHLIAYKKDPNAVIIAIPRGALELGNILAKELELPLDVIFTKKIAHPTNPEYAIGAASASHMFVDEPFKQIAGLDGYIAQQVTNIREMIAQREKTYRADMPPLDLKNKTVIVVDDGIATGNTMLATLALIAQQQPNNIIVALPVAPADSLEKIKQRADEVICLEVPAQFRGVSQFYRDFKQVEDKDAIKLLQEANQ